jgi:putative addiction module antidote
MKLKLRAIGKSTGLVLPKGFLKHLRVKRNDFLIAVEVPGGYFLTAYDPEIAEHLKLGREFMKKYQDAFRALAN